MARKAHIPTIVRSVLIVVLLSWCAAIAAEPPTSGESGINRALILDGAADFMRVPDTPSLHMLDNAITMELWFKASSFQPEQGLINSLLRKNVWAGQENFFIRFRTIDSTPCLEVSAGLQIGTLRTYHEFETGRWYHLAATYDGSTLTAYVNGAKIDSRTASGRMTIDESDLFIGKGDPDFSEGEYFHGALDEIRLWNVARSEQDIKATMDTTVTGKEEGLVAYWNFDDGTATDLTGHGNDGLLSLIVESHRPTSEELAKRAAATQAAEVTLPEGIRERARDGIVHIEEGIIRDMPTPPRLCDSLNIEKKMVDVGDCRLYCEQEGRGTPLVLLHGGPGSTHHGFHPHFSKAAAFARVIYYDQRGCGQSDYEPGAGYCMDQAVDDLDRLREALGIDQWVVLGHSYGGLLAQCYAVKYPENMKGLILTCASTGLHGPSMPSRERQFISTRERQKLNQIRNTPGLSVAQLIYNNFLNGDWKRQSYYRPTREQIARTALYEWVHDDNFNGLMSRSANAVDLAGVFAECPVATFIIEAEWDMSWNTDKRDALRKNHPHAQYILFEEAGHSPFEDEPEKYFGVLKEFIGNLSAVSTEKAEQWKDALPRQEDSPAAFVSDLGWGQYSSRRIASKYDPTWLNRIDDAWIWLKIGFALYDAKRYDDALSAFEKMEKTAIGDPRAQVTAIIWQGHMLDLLERREEAIARYEKAAEMNVDGYEQQHNQYGLVYVPSKYARERMSTPFVRVENRQTD